MLKERFLDRGSECSAVKGTVYSSSNESNNNRVFYVISGKLVYRIFSGDSLLAEFDCLSGSLAGIVEVCAPHTGGGRFEIHVKEDSTLYSWDGQEFSIALGIFQELATKVIKNLSSLLRQVNHLVNNDFVNGVDNG